MNDGSRLVIDGLANFDNALCQGVVGDDHVIPDRIEQFIAANQLATTGREAGQYLEGHSALVWPDS